ncbi:hypothetical protein LV28_24620 [Pandoraea pnomenusa]|uniref:Uncharacterized protein n=1 Tax=Pandoraea pnomenusa TaxID=93220 RepID=A0A378YXU3_9BURK|nr:hypothetical protein [Pandoraea pnomenusa]AIU29332.1 hypothetical protein LV28_24620 [Pandoraea pnomenusa]SUA81976.1 Uncharacterised protein [Pandoraea pnomenusa]
MSDQSSGNCGSATTADHDTAYRRKLFDAYWVEQQTRERANREKYDNTILAYSTGALALSITFIKEVVPLANASSVWTIKTSWVLFALSLLLMLASFPIAAKANRESVRFAEEYFIDHIESSYNKEGIAAKILKYVNVLAGMVFFAAAGFTIAFVWINVRPREATMSDPTEKPATVTVSLVMEGVGSASMPILRKAAQPTQAAASGASAKPPSAPSIADTPKPAPTSTSK